MYGLKPSKFKDISNGQHFVSDEMYSQIYRKIDDKTALKFDNNEIQDWSDSPNAVVYILSIP